jgi:Protein of unknown function (DUF664)
MTVWTAPPRPEPPYAAGERTLLEGFLDWQRATLLLKCAGLTADQLVERACPPSTLSLLGLVRHLSEVERGWFVHDWQPGVPEIYCSPDNRDGDLDDTDPAQADADLQLHLREVAAAREQAARHDLGDTVDSVRGDGSVVQISLRWIYIHMIEEYARHNGHADLLREKLDGVTGE